MKLHFPWSDLQAAFEELDTATVANPLHGRATGKGLWLVGDEGVYLMPNTTDGIHHRASKQRVVVYAKECDPRALPFDTWWKNKAASFGADDGVDFIKTDEIRMLAVNPIDPTKRPSALVVELSQNSFLLSIGWESTHWRSPLHPQPRFSCRATDFSRRSPCPGQTNASAPSSNFGAMAAPPPKSPRFWEMSPATRLSERFIA